jgi:hypothetical protein
MYLLARLDKAVIPILISSLVKIGFKLAELETFPGGGGGGVPWGGWIK